MILFFTIPVWILFLFIIAMAGFFETFGGVISCIFNLFVLSIVLLAIFYLIAGIYKAVTDSDETFEGIITAIIAALVISLWWWIFM